MTTISGLAAHPLLVHFLVALTPLAAILAILCAVWPAARQRLVWLVLVLSLMTAVVTPVVSNSGEWLEGKLEKSELIEKHAALGDTMIYFALALLVAAILLAVVHVRAGRGRTLPTALSAAIAVFVVIAAVATTVQVIRIGHSGAESAWSDALAGTAAEPANGG
ncbi:MAG: DUF2231 domain-containing protein [Mycobacterium sp.]|jgi:uncharacterized membrane protein